MTHGPLTWTRRQILAGAIVSPLAPSVAPARATQEPGPAPRLRHGVGLHHLLNWPDTTGEGSSLRYTWPPFAAPNYQIAPGELSALARVGFDFVRLTVDPSIFIVTGESRRPVLEHLAISMVRRLIEAGLSVVFDLHPVEVNPAYSPAALIDPKTPDRFATYTAMVGRIALMLKDLPPERVALEPFNEPPIEDLAQAPRWQAMLERLHQAIRAADPMRPVVLNGAQWDSIDGLQALDTRPFRGSNVLYTFHYYDPHAYTHQGVQPDTRWLEGLRWPEDDENVRAVEAHAQSAIAADRRLSPVERAEAELITRSYTTQMLNAHPGPARIVSDFEMVSDWAKTNGLTAERVLLGEFGCVAHPNGLSADRLAWLAAVRSASEAAGFGWAYWAYRGNAGMTLMDAKGTLDSESMGALGLIR